MEHSISLSVLDQMNLKNDIRRILDSSDGKVNRFHIDIADGSFVPWLGNDPELVHVIRNEFGDAVKLDAHLLVEHPSRFIDVVADYADNVLFHAECLDRDWMRLIDQVDVRCGVGVSLFPCTDVSIIRGLVDRNVIDCVNFVCNVHGNNGEYHYIIKDNAIRLMENLDKVGFRIQVDGHFPNSGIWHWSDYEEIGVDLLVHEEIGQNFFEELKLENTNTENTGDSNTND